MVDLDAQNVGAHLPLAPNALLSMASGRGKDR